MHCTDFWDLRQNPDEETVHMPNWWKRGCAIRAGPVNAAFCGGRLGAPPSSDRCLRPTVARRAQPKTAWPVRAGARTWPWRGGNESSLGVRWFWCCVLVWRFWSASCRRSGVAVAGGSEYGRAGRSANGLSLSARDRITRNQNTSHPWSDAVSCYAGPK